MQIRSVNCKKNQDFILVVTQSGDTQRVNDYDFGKEYYLPVDVNDTTLGEAVLGCLAACRWITYDDDPSFFYPMETIVPRYKQWVADTMAKYGYKTKTKMFRYMDNCSLDMKDNKITVAPYHHRALEAWSGQDLEGKNNVIIPADSSPAEIGAALKLAFSRCTSY